MIGVAYCRVSTKLDEQKHSFEEQKKEWIEFSDKEKITRAPFGVLYKKDGTKEYNTLGIFGDEGISRKRFKKTRSF